jgi:RNA polymerase sigma factor (sigma-70 family)
VTEGRSEAELVEAAREGDEEAFGLLLGRYRDAVFGVAFHRLGDFEEARDVVQDVFVKVYLGLGSLRDPSAFARWLYRIADGTATDAARRRRQELPLTGAEVAPDRTPEAEAAREVREMISRLSEPARLAVVVHYVNGYSHAEVAQFLGTTPEAVKMRLSRARKQLREEMVEMAGDRISKAARGREGRLYEYRYIAKDALGRVITGTSEAENKQILIRRLREKGYFVQKVESRRRRGEAPEPAPTESTREAIRRIVAVILEQAIRDRASAIRVEPGKEGGAAGHGPRNMFFQYRVGDSWHDIASTPIYVWQPLRERFAEMAGVPLRDEGEQRGSLQFEMEGKSYTARVKMSPGQVWVEMPVDASAPTKGTAADEVASALYNIAATGAE